MKEEIKVAIAEDHILVREGLITLLQNDKTIKILFDVNNGKELLDKISSSKPDVLLLDIEMPVMSGKEALKIIRQRYSKLKVIILSSHFQEDVIIDFIKLGAKAFLPKDINRSKLIDAIHTVHGGGTYFDGKVSDIMARELSTTNGSQSKEEKIKFNDTELSIIKMICQNKINKEMAEALNLSVRTVEWHRANIMNAIKSKDVNDLILYAVQNRLVNIL